MRITSPHRPPSAEPHPAHHPYHAEPHQSRQPSLGVHSQSSALPDFHIARTVTHQLPLAAGSPSRRRSYLPVQVTAMATPGIQRFPTHNPAIQSSVPSQSAHNRHLPPPPPPPPHPDFAPRQPAFQHHYAFQPQPSLPGTMYPPVPQNVTPFSPVHPSQPGMPNPMTSPAVRDNLLAYAHTLYNSADSDIAKRSTLVSLPLPASRTLASTGVIPGGASLAPIPGEPRGFEPLPHPLTTRLLPLLTSLSAFHPTHCPTLLLLGCVLFATGDLDGCLKINSTILSLEPDHVRILISRGPAAACSSITQYRQKLCRISAPR
ncbi:hypothetical protein BOTBODRAFT_595109 [Botryobasidium botryosum FD-172 SS1]|uniref:Uncharacterized protein n=1 Tax=Botryobasidium botryosum (strain FD-172 SS1) TaxID=930990 RepID=A0A067M731_BOTB1|nr:hypothetical protein BOTBODRAFT_595109 [Botryobasidium botryosum FD-172 SS1]